MPRAPIRTHRLGSCWTSTREQCQQRILTTLPRFIGRRLGDREETGGIGRRLGDREEIGGDREETGGNMEETGGNMEETGGNMEETGGNREETEGIGRRRRE